MYRSALTWGAQILEADTETSRELQKEINILKVSVAPLLDDVV
jgi:hypothetical protein